MPPLSWSPQRWFLQRGLDPTPVEARKWLRDELRGASYQGSWLDSVVRWVLDQLGALANGASRATASGVGPVVTVLVSLVVVGLLVWVLPKVRRESAVESRSGTVLDDLAITAATYRKRASAALAQGRFDDSALDGFRAIARDMSDRTLLDDAPGRTAQEVSVALALPFSDHAERLAQAANLFDAVRYGHRHATGEQAGRIQQLDAELVRTRPRLATPARTQGLAV